MTGEEDADDETENGEEEDGDTLAKLTAATDRILDRWEQSQPEEVRQAAISRYVEHGDGDAEASGLEELEGQVMVAAYTHRLETEVCQPFGIDHSTFLSHIAEEHEPLFRQAVVKGEWDWLRSWARSVAEHRATKR